MLILCTVFRTQQETTLTLEECHTTRRRKYWKSRIRENKSTSRDLRKNGGDAEMSWKAKDLHELRWTHGCSHSCMSFCYIPSSSFLFLSNQGIISEHTSLRIPIPKTRKMRRTRTRKTAVLRGGMKTIRTTVSRARTSSNRTTRTYLASSALTKRGFRGPYPGKSRVTQLCILFRDVTINL